MKRITSFLLTTFVATVIYAQAPANYYNNATGTGYVLKSQLKTIISINHSPLSYTPGLWNLYNSSDPDNGFRDKYYENDDSILDIYSENPNGTEYTFTPISDQCGNYSSEGDCYNREHLIPQSYFDELSPMVTDAFHIWPTDGKVNGQRGNLPFGTVNTPNYTSQNGTKRGSSAVSGFSGTVVEPIDEFKGDIARAYFYFATRYEDLMDDFYTDHPGAAVRAMFDGSIDRVFDTNFLAVLYQWHIQDPVGQREKDINNYIYQEQGNRNPYIDNPEYVTAVWFPELLDAPNFDLVPFNLYPNPAKNSTIFISSKEKINLITIYSVNGILIRKISNPVFVDEVYKISNLPRGMYLIRVESGTNTSSKKFIVE
ncbi:MAG TPA: endonuclease [Flavobacterium sp.]|nr:endonuclease [Flavobacterium sp.]